jgi:hypothetical protein
MGSVVPAVVRIILSGMGAAGHHEQILCHFPILCVRSP